MSAVHEGMDGDIRNATPGLSFGRVFNPTTNFDFRLRPSRKRFGGAANLALGLPSACAGAAWPLPLTSVAANLPVSFTKLRTLPQDTTVPNTVKSRGVSLTIDYDVNDDFTVCSITGYRKLDTRSQQKLDGGNVSIINNNLNLLTAAAAALPPGGLTPYRVSCSFQKQFSGELQFLGKSGDMIDAWWGFTTFERRVSRTTSSFPTTIRLIRCSGSGRSR